MAQPLALFRADAGPAIGLGHVFRCATLAAALEARGWDWMLAVRGTPEIDDILGPLGIAARRIVYLTGDDAGHPAAMAKAAGRRIDAAIIDHYGLGADFARAMRAHARRIVVIDDLVDRPFDADILINQNPGFSDGEYRPWTAPTTTLLVGARYAIVRDAFIAARGATLQDRKARPAGVRRILVSLGGSDPDDITSGTLRALAEARPNLRIDAVLAGIAPHLANVRRTVADVSGATLHVDIANMHELMHAADIAVGAGGTTSFERCCLGLPTVLVQTADNQARTIAALYDAGAALVAGTAASDGAAAIGRTVAAAVGALAGAPDRLAEMSARAAEVCDGQGKTRIVDAIVQSISASG